ncbi:MAG: S1/P1 nuclease [Spirochaetota bacterium]
MRSFRITVLASTLCLFLFSPASGWDGGGHMLVARIAHDRLDAAARQRVSTIASRLNNNGTNYTFITLACWMDDIKDRNSTSPYKGKFRTWHYINIGCSPSDPDVFADSAALTATNGDIVRALSHATSALRIGKFDEIIPDEAIALAVIVHLAGDIHQPMHTASRYDPNPTKGESPNDAGGNAVSIANLADTPWKKNLHTFWDEAYRRYYDDGKARALPELTADDGTGMHEWLDRLTPHTPTNLAFDAHRWARETQSLGCTLAYGELREPYGAKNIVLKERYVTGAAAAAQRQIVLAGWRLASLLQGMYRK